MPTTLTYARIIFIFIGLIASLYAIGVNHPEYILMVGTAVTSSLALLQATETQEQTKQTDQKVDTLQQTQTVTDQKVEDIHASIVNGNGNGGTATPK